jgi:prepilin-type N-terminal cleavage/methylation domain-containing protein
MKMFRKDEGFTLVELMVVVLIIGILVAIAIPVFNAAKTNAETKSCRGTMRTVEGQARAYEAETGSLPTAIGDLTGGTSPYLKSTPKCPTTGATYSYATLGTDGRVSCSVHLFYDSTTLATVTP